MKKINKVLLVDDDIASNYLAKSILRDMNLTEQLIICENGLEAIITIERDYHEGVEDWCPDLILLDLSMPMMTGYDFLNAFESIKPENRDIPIFILSASDQASDIEKAEKFGAAGYIVKPLTHEIIEQITERLVD